MWLWFGFKRAMLSISQNHFHSQKLCACERVHIFTTLMQWQHLLKATHQLVRFCEKKRDYEVWRKLHFLSTGFRCSLLNMEMFIFKSETQCFFCLESSESDFFVSPPRRWTQTCYWMHSIVQTSERLHACDACLVVCGGLFCQFAPSPGTGLSALPSFRLPDCFFCLDFDFLSMHT